MPIAVVGSGRSGTSMVAQMLSICGAYIGRPADMESPPDHDNPNGYWEHRALRSINTRIFEAFGATDKGPPALPASWADHPSIAPLYAEARSIVQREFTPQSEWIWKDPRAAATSAFWDRIAPDMVYVLCVRNPIDVVRSLSLHLSGHGASQFQFEGLHGYALWYYYNAQFLMDADPRRRAVTFYEDYFPDYRKGLAPVLEAVGLPTVQRGFEIDISLSALVDPALQHHASSLADVVESAAAPYVVKELYLQMQASGIRGESPEILRFSEAFMPLLQAVASAEYAASEARRMEAILGTRPHRFASALSRFVNGLPFRRRPND